MKTGCAIVVGGTSGLGEELVSQLSQLGYKVASVGRNKDVLDEQAKIPNVSAYEHNVLETDQIESLFLKITGELGGCDLFIYSAGVMSDVAGNEFDTDKDFQMIQVNFAGAVAWINQAAARMQGTKHGSIVAIGSVAGERGRQGQPVYNATKAALATYMESVRNRLVRHGVNVVTIKPGPLDTPMTKHLKISKMPVDFAAKKVIQLSDKNGEHFLKPTHRLIFFVIRNFPSPLFKHLKI